MHIAGAGADSVTDDGVDETDDRWLQGKITRICDRAATLVIGALILDTRRALHFCSIEGGRDGALEHLEFAVLLV